MKVWIKETPEGPVTQAQYVGPCGFPMAASFQGVVSPPEIERRLKYWRALAEQRRRPAS